MRTLSEVQKLIDESASPKDLFGDDVDAGLKQFLVELHPDRHPNDADLATKLFQQVQQLADKAKKPPIVLKSKKHEYVLGTLWKSGDLANLYKTDKYLVKVSKVPVGEHLLKAEWDNLAKLHQMAGDETYRKYLPLPVETFPITNKFPRRVNTFLFEGGFYSLTEVLEMEAKKRGGQQGLHGRHLAWVFKRLLTVLGFMHSQGIVHGAVLPQHILIRPVDHALKLVGWGQSVSSQSVLRNIVTSCKDWYPDEVLKKQSVSSATDIFMAAKCVEWLGGGQHSVKVGAPPLYSFLRACMLPGQFMRPDDAWKLLEEFDELLLGIYGKPRFVDLVLE
jgi:hypothetical protein